jgi:hypothetical protein
MEIISNQGFSGRLKLKFQGGKSGLAGKSNSMGPGDRFRVAVIMYLLGRPSVGTYL